jgi:hypothetical protein
VAGIVTDIMERKHAEQHVHLLADAGRILCDSLHSTTTLQEIAQLAVSRIASFCSFDLLNEIDGGVERAAWACSESSKNRFGDQVWKSVPATDWPDSPVSKTLRSGKTEFVPLVTDEWMRKAATSDTQYDFMRDVDFRSLIVAPVAACGRSDRLR